jgi:hypothetical protein
MKKLLWTSLLMVSSAAAATITGRAMTRLWRIVTDEQPPEMPWWAKWLVGKPLRAGVSGALSPSNGA